MHAASGSDAGWTLPAVPSSVGQMRRRAAAFASGVGASDEMVRAVALAVSETVTNAVVHAYAGSEPGCVDVRCRTDGERLFRGGETHQRSRGRLARAGIVGDRGFEVGVGLAARGRRCGRLDLDLLGLHRRVAAIERKVVGEIQCHVGCIGHETPAI